MRIPSDLETKLDLLRSSLPHLVESYAKLVMIAEKAVKRMEAAAADQARMAMTLATLSEKQPASCWRCADGAAANGIGGNACGLCKGVARGLSAVGDAFTREAEDTDRRVRARFSGVLQKLTICAGKGHGVGQYRDAETGARYFCSVHPALPPA